VSATSLADDPQESRRFLIAVGAARYEGCQLEDLDVNPDLTRVCELFEARGYTRVLAEISVNPTAIDLRSALENWLVSPDRRMSDATVIYYAGHGLKAPGGHYLMCADSREDRLVSSALRADDLALMVAGAPTRGDILVILDTCYAGGGVGDMAAVASQLTAVQPAQSRGLWLLASARAKEVAVDHAFVDGLSHALKLARAGAHQAFIDLTEITERINSSLKQFHPYQRASCTTINTGGPAPFFPNPDYVPGLSGADLDVEVVHRMRQERRTHFGPRGRGVEHPGEPGSYFTGRLAALTDLVTWLSNPEHDGRARLITGAPGSGKSAVLGHLLSLADGVADHSYSGPYPLPPLQCITAHILARRRSLEEITAQIGRTIGTVSDSVDELLVALAGREGLFTLLIDALDEAGNAGYRTEATRIAHELLRPLSAMPNVRLIVGTRYGPVRAIGPAVRVIDLDNEEYQGPEDVTDYVTSLLLAADNPASLSPYRDEPIAATLVARGIAARAGKSFLVARMIARSVIYGDVIIDTGSRDWQDHLPGEVTEAFASYLARFGERERKVRRLLAPLAYAEDQGLPWDRIWASLATALSGEECSDDDIGWLLENASDYIVESAIGDRSVFRLYHEALAEYLRDPRRIVESHARIMETLLDQVSVLPGSHKRNWLMAHPYTRTHIASHGTAGNRIHDLLADPEFLVYAEPATLVPALRDVASQADALVASIYRSSIDRHRHASSSTRRELLALDAARYRNHGFSRSLSESLAWIVRWASGSQTSSALRATLSEPPVSGIRTLTSGVVDGRVVVITGSRDGVVRVWDIATGELRAKLVGHSGGVQSVAYVHTSEGPLLVTGGRDGTVRVWDLATEIQRAVLRGHDGWVRSVACSVVHDKQVAVTGSSDGTVRVWDLASGEEIAVLSGHTNWINAVACTTLDHSPVALSGSRDGTVRLWDLESFELRASFDGHTGGVYTVACTELDNRPVAITGGDDRRLRVWMLETQEQLAVLVGHMGWIRGVACTALDNQPNAVSGGDDGTVRVWDLEAGQQRALLTGHTGWVLGVACTVLDGRPLATTGGDDGIVRVWDLAGVGDLPVRTGHTGQVKAIAFASLKGRRLALSGGTDLAIRVWDIETGEVRAMLTGHTGTVNAIATATIAGQPRLVSVGSDSTMRIWDLRAGDQTAVLHGHAGLVQAVACATVRGAPIAVSGADDGLVRVWNLDAGEQYMTLEGHTSGVTSIACTVLQKRPVAVTGGSDGTIRAWDLETGEEVASLHGHVGWVRTVLCLTLHGRVVVASSGDDRMVRLWDLEGAAEIAVLHGHTGAVNALACSRDRERPLIFTGSDDCTVRVWDAATQVCRDVLALPYPVGALAAGQPSRIAVGAGWEVCIYDRSANIGKVHNGWALSRLPQLGGLLAGERESAPDGHEFICDQVYGDELHEVCVLSP
jgi:WD40 repeat protein